MTMQRTIKVLIVDDQAAVRSGLTAFLLAFDDLELAGEAASGEEAVRLTACCHADVVLMDLVMPGMDGAAATRAIRQQCPHVRVIALTSFPEEQLVQQALKAGATGYLLKNIFAHDLYLAIRATHAGQLILGPEAARAIGDTSPYAEALDRALVGACHDYTAK